MNEIAQNIMIGFVFLGLNVIINKTLDNLFPGTYEFNNANLELRYLYCEVIKKW